MTITFCFNTAVRRMARGVMVAVIVAACCGGGVAYGQKKNKTEKTSAVADEALLKIDCQMIDAKTQEEIGNKEGAARIYRKIMTERPSYAAAYYELGGMMLDKGAVDSALILTQKAISLEKTNLWYRLQETEIYERMQDYKRLAKCWEEIVNQHNDVLDYYYELADAYLMDNNGEKAIKVLDRIEKRYGVSETVSLHQKEIWEAMGRSDKALDEIEQLAKAMPHETKYSAMMAEVYMKRKDYKRAKQYYDQVLKNNPNDEFIHFSLANYYKHTGDRAAAHRELEQGLRQPTLGCMEKLHVISSYFVPSDLQGERLKEALGLTAIVTEQCGDEPEVAGFYGSLLMYDQQYAEASGQFKNLLRTDSSRYESWEMLLVCLNMSQAPRKEVHDYAKRAAKLFPLNIMPTYILGMHALMDRDYREAQKLLNRCEMMGFRHGYLEPQTYSMLGDCYYWLGDYSRAWKYFDKALKITPDDIGTLNNYAYYLSERGEQLEKALQMSKKTIEQEPENATYLDTYAWILHKMGRNAEALPYMEKAVKHNDENSETLTEHLRIIREAAGK